MTAGGDETVKFVSTDTTPEEEEGENFFFTFFTAGLLTAVQYKTLQYHSIGTVNLSSYQSQRLFLQLKNQKVE